MFLAALLVSLTDNTLTKQEINEGWTLLFDGATSAGWHNFKKTTVASGWKVVEGALTVVEPEKAGDICTDKKFEWFELKIDFKLEPGQNSGIMFHVADSGEATWHSGPEIQIYDHPIQDGVETTGFLYQLYKSEADASKPAGQWNHFDILVSKETCWTKLNGVKCYEYQLGSEDFWARVAKSKFAEHPEFAKSNSGSIAIQGDHGKVAFKNIKIRKAVD
ncbi:MAG: DUF1080 domain-containing protein [Chthonomonadaceae bacterium]|jgi:hypothetical protein|nr:DUF1080 domain-containing protein [Chthonomonadaceae bacterium]